MPRFGDLGHPVSARYLKNPATRNDRWLILAKIETEFLDLWLVVMDALREFYRARILVGRKPKALRLSSSDHTLSRSGNLRIDFLLRFALPTTA
jgi:hypothetical protein